MHASIPQDFWDNAQSFRHRFGQDQLFGEHWSHSTNFYPNHEESNIQAIKFHTQPQYGHTLSISITCLLYEISSGFVN